MKEKIQCRISHRPSTSTTRMNPQIEINGCFSLGSPSCQPRAMSPRGDPQRRASGPGDVAGEARREHVEAEEAESQGHGRQEPRGVRPCFWNSGSTGRRTEGFLREGRALGLRTQHGHHPPPAEPWTAAQAGVRREDEPGTHTQEALHTLPGTGKRIQAEGVGGVTGWAERTLWDAECLPLVTWKGSFGLRHTESGTQTRGAPTRGTRGDSHPDKDAPPLTFVLKTQQPDLCLRQEM